MSHEISGKDAALIGVGVGVGAAAWDLSRVPMTGRAYLDHAQPGSPISLRAMTWGLARLRGVPPALALAQLVQEASPKGEPSIGDLSSSLGPAIGPLQITLSLAKALGYVPSTTTQEQYAALAGDTWSTLWWGLGAIRDALDHESKWSSAAGYYNGGPNWRNNAGADYQDRVAELLTQWGAW